MSSNNKVFGQTMKPKAFSAKKRLNSNLSDGSKSLSYSGSKLSQKRLNDTEKDNLRQDDAKIEEIFGFERIKTESPRLGWLLNYLPTTMQDESGMERSGIDLFFIDRQGGSFKASLFFEPYFYVDASDPARIMEISQHLPKRLEGCRVEIIDKEDLDMANHLSGKTHRFLKLSFSKVSDLMAAKSVLR
jgi:DNA polymerase epsilon subunit 1